MCLLSLPRKPTDQKPCIPQTSGTCDLSSLHYWSLLAGCSHPISHGALDVARSTGGGICVAIVLLGSGALPNL